MDEYAITSLVALLSHEQNVKRLRLGTRPWCLLHLQLLHNFERLICMICWESREMSLLGFSGIALNKQFKFSCCKCGRSNNIWCYAHRRNFLFSRNDIGQGKFAFLLSKMLARSLGPEKWFDVTFRNPTTSLWFVGNANQREDMNQLELRTKIILPSISISRLA